jgi:hypothetical protein
MSAALLIALPDGSALIRAVIDERSVAMLRLRRPLFQNHLPGGSVIIRAVMQERSVADCIARRFGFNSDCH